MSTVVEVLRWVVLALIVGPWIAAVVVAVIVGRSGP